MVIKASFKSPPIIVVSLRFFLVSELLFTTSDKPSPSNTRASGKTSYVWQNEQVAKYIRYSRSNILKPAGSGLNIEMTLKYYMRWTNGQQPEKLNHIPMSCYYYNSSFVVIRTCARKSKWQHVSYFEGHYNIIWETRGEFLKYLYASKCMCRKIIINWK